MPGMSQKQNTLPGTPDRAEGTEAITYRIGKMEFVITPVYNESAGKSIHNLLLALMKRDGEKP